MKNSSFLDYYKLILKKVSFDHYLLKKEYLKAKKVITPQDQAELDSWMNENGLSVSS